MKKIVIGAMVVGFLIALSFGAVSIYDYRHGTNILPTGNIAIYLWPTGLMLIDANDDTAGYIVWAVAAIGNALLYGLVAWVITIIWRVFADWRKPDESWWPHNPR